MACRKGVLYKVPEKAFVYKFNLNGVSKTEEVIPRNWVRVGKKTIFWKFLWKLLENPNDEIQSVTWVERSKFLFRIDDSEQVERLWQLDQQQDTNSKLSKMLA